MAFKVFPPIKISKVILRCLWSLRTYIDFFFILLTKIAQVQSCLKEGILSVAKDSQVDWHLDFDYAPLIHESNPFYVGSST